MMEDVFQVALITDVFFGDDDEARLERLLHESVELGAELAVLPELPFNSWAPATKAARDEDAEGPRGPRFEAQKEAARRAGIGLVGGAIVQDPDTDNRYNTAFLFDGSGRLLQTYEKLHIPEEPGFWETSHYSAGRRLPAVAKGLRWPLGLQICSDVNRPECTHALAAAGAAVIVAPRATEEATYERWKLVLRANALTSCVYLLSVNRPGPEMGVEIGGPSLAISPSGEILLETTEAVQVVALKGSLLGQARKAYPGYLPVRADIYSRAWAEVAE